MISGLWTSGLIGLAAMAAPLAAQAPGAGSGQNVQAGVQAWQIGNYEEAVRRWRPLAERGDPDALFNLGHAYRLGRGVSQDMARAEDHYARAARAGHVEAQAMYGLILFQNGRRQEAMPFVRAAAENGDARAQYVYGTALFNGDVIARDWPRAFAFMTRAAAQGLPYAQTQLREMERHIPAADRTRGTQLAAEMASGRNVSADLAMAAPDSPLAITARPASPPARPPRVAQTELPPSTAATPPARPAPAPPAAAAPVRATTPAPAPAASGRWRIQLGAFSNEANARRAWSNVSGRLPGMQPFYARAGNLVRLQAGPLTSRAAAERACAGLGGQACFPVAP